MKSIVTFDTNYIIENKGNMKTIINDIKEKYNVVIAQIVIEEVKGQRARETIKTHKNILEKINEAKKENSWLSIIDNTDVEGVIESQEKQLDDWLKKACNHEVVKIENENLLETILERCKYKKPPFNNEEHSSDKGFKDTILFLNLMQYMKNSKYGEIYLFTNDNAFIKYKKSLQEEFFNNTGKELKIVNGEDNSLYIELNIKKQDKEKQKTEESNSEIFPSALPKSKDIREQTKNLLNDIFTKLDTESNWNFVTFKEAKSEEIGKSVEGLNQIINKFIFLDKIDINYIFDIQANTGELYISDLEKLINLYSEMNKEEREALIYSITCRFNSYYHDLPF